MVEQTVLAVDSGDVAFARPDAETAPADASFSVRVCADLGSLYDELVHAEVHALLLPAAVDGKSAVRIAAGVKTLYPNLPIVVYGTPPDVVPDGLDVTAVPAETATDDRVVEAVADALDEGGSSHAARPPSRMETMLLSMFDQFPFHLYAKDETGRHAIVSRHANEPTDLIGLTDLEYVDLPIEHREAAYRDEMRVIEEEDQVLGVEEYTDYIDSHTLTTKVPWYHGEEGVVGLVGVTRDITERKQREYAARRQQELLVKLAILSAHEFRNELQVALGRLELVEDDPSQVEVIQRSHDQLVDIVDKIIELASRERQTREEKPVWFSTLSREVWDTLPDADATLRIEDDARAVVDPESVSLFLQIIFDNALEHAGPDVTVTFGATEDGFFVADDGPGLECDPPDRVFDAGYTTEPDNTGFGLFVARSIAHEHNWAISVSESDAGGVRYDVSGLELLD